MFRMLAVVALAAVATGCANLSTVFRKFDLAEGRSVSLDAQQRTILVTRIPDEFGGRDRMVYCAEPSPDSLFAIGSSFGASGGLARGSGDKGEVELAQVLASAASDALSTRNATIQLLRDGLYRACEAYASGALSRLEYADITWRYQKMVLALLSIELVSNLNRPRREVSVTGMSGSAAAPKPDAGAAKGESKGATELKTAAVLVKPAAGGTSAPAPAPYTNESIETISATALNLVTTVLQSEDRVAQCLRYLSQLSYQRTRAVAHSPRASLMEDLCANIVSRYALPSAATRLDTVLK